MSGRVDVANILGGIVAWGISLALCPGRSLCIWAPSNSVAWVFLNRQENAIMPPSISAL